MCLILEGECCTLRKICKNITVTDMSLLLTFWHDYFITFPLCFKPVHTHTHTHTRVTFFFAFDCLRVLAEFFDLWAVVVYQVKPPSEEFWFKSQLLHLWFSILQMHPRRQQTMGCELGPLPPTRKAWIESWLLVQSWLSLPFRGELENERFSLSLSIPPHPVILLSSKLLNTFLKNF